MLTGLAAGESVVPLNCLVFFLPGGYMMLTAEWISRTARADLRPMLNPTFIFFLQIFELTY